MSKEKVMTIRPLEGYHSMRDTSLIQAATSVVTGLDGNSNFTNLPIDLETVKADVETFAALVNEALDGSRKVIAQRNTQREVVIKKLRLLGRFVEVHCDGDMAKFMSSGFLPASNAKTSPAPLPLPVIKSVTHGAVSGELVVRMKAIPKAVLYEVRYGFTVNGQVPEAWTMIFVTQVRPAVRFHELTPGTVYAVQVRARGVLGYTDWTDSTTCMCV